MLGDYGSQKMYAGQIIQYRLKPLLQIPGLLGDRNYSRRREEYFVDEQRYGPYSFWHHEHFFKEISGGVEMNDIVHYKLPFGILGKFMHAILVGRQLQGIFEYRKEVLEKRFGIMK